jgi:hypothetical protein
MTVTAAQIISEIRAVAAEQPGYMYLAYHCLYVERSGDVVVPSCIVGHALWRLGVIDEKFYFSSHNDEAVIPTLHMLGIRATRQQLRWLETVQKQQDEGAPCSSTVQTADRKVNLNV